MSSDVSFSSSLQPDPSHQATNLHKFAPDLPESTSTVAKTKAFAYRMSVYVSPRYIANKGKAWLSAKIFPLKPPEDTAKEIRACQADLKRLKMIVAKTSESLEILKNQINALENSSRKSHQKLESPKLIAKQRQERIERLTPKIQKLELYIQHLQTKNNTVIASRGTGYISSAMNAALPGSGPITNVLLTSATMAVPEISAAAIHNMQEKKRVRWGTALTMLSFVTSTAVSYYVLPVITEIAKQKLLGQP